MCLLICYTYVLKSDDTTRKFPKDAEKARRGRVGGTSLCYSTSFHLKAEVKSTHTQVKLSSLDVPNLCTFSKWSFFRILYTRVIALHM